MKNGKQKGPYSTGRQQAEDLLKRYRDEFQRWYAKLQRAARALEKARLRVVYYQEKLDRLR